MKKIMIAAVAVMALCAVSCNKSKDCTCTTTQTMPDMDPMVTTTVVTSDNGKCDKLNATSTTTTPNGNITQTVECK